MDKAEIVKYKDYLLANLKLRGEYDSALGMRKSVLMVEGQTDVAFAAHVLRRDARCLPVVELIKARNAFSSSPPPKVNHKEIITTILQHISMFPDVCDFPKGAELWPLYGLIDNDYNTGASFSKVDKLFVTDTHDIETLLIASDADLLTRLQQCPITSEEIRTALYLAKQLSVFRQAMVKNGTINQQAINSPDGTVDFSQFTEGDRINLGKFLQHANSHLASPLSKEKLKRVKDKIAAVPEMKKSLDKEGLWKKANATASYGLDDPLWIDINGHDVLSAIMYVNENAKEVFSNSGGFNRNRDFEFALIDAYDYNQFKKTRLFERLSEKGLLIEF